MSNEPKRAAHEKIMGELRGILAGMGVKTRVISVAVSGSCYFGFSDERMGKCRVGDHEESRRYGYRWQIRTDMKERSKVEYDKGHPQYFYHPNCLYVAAEHMKDYLEAIRRRPQQ